MWMMQPNGTLKARSPLPQKRADSALDGVLATNIFLFRILIIP
jgi:hypothetical protein